MIDDILDLAREDYLPAHAKAYKGALERAAIELRRLTTHDGPCDCDLCRSSRIVARQTEAIKGLRERLAIADMVIKKFEKVRDINCGLDQATAAGKIEYLIALADEALKAYARRTDGI